MADISNQLITKIARGVPVRFYIKPTINADGTITLSAAGGLDAAAHVNAKEIGFTQDGLVMTRETEFEDLPVDQRSTGILESLTNQVVHIKTKILQIRDYANMVALNPGTVAMSGSGFSGMSDQLTQTFDLMAVAAVAPTPNDATKFQVMLLYAAVNRAPFNASLAKQYASCEVDLVAKDAGRVDGKTWAWYETVAP